MNRIEILEQSVRAAYAAKDPGRDEWADWLLDNHVIWVANKATELARRFGANEELARAAALLHDIGDIKMARFADGHGEESLAIGRDLMKKAGYSEDEIKLVVDDAVCFHSCFDGREPASLEGKVLSTADALGHLKTDFYVFAPWAISKRMTMEELKGWALKKLDRDFNDKIQFDEIREECKEDYKWLKALYGR